MSHTLEDIAKELKDANKKVQLIYAFNGSGKTRLSGEFKELIDPKQDDIEEDQKSKILYYNAFTEDLFYWDNDLDADAERKLKIQPNAYTKSALEDLGLDTTIISNFQHYTKSKLTPNFSASFSEVTFSIERGDETNIDNVKISKGEESNFIFSIFYTLIDQIIDTLNTVNIEDRETDQFNDLEYIFIDDPVSSLDDNHLIQLAVDIATLVKRSDYIDGNGLRFIITTHNPLFFNVLHNEFIRDDKGLGYKGKTYSRYRLEKDADGLFNLETQPNDSPFAYHLYLLNELKTAAETGEIRKYHFNMIRNILEKSATFLGYKSWTDLLPRAEDGRPNSYQSRIIDASSHSKQSGEEVAFLKNDDKRVFKYLVKNIDANYHNWRWIPDDATTN